MERVLSYSAYIKFISEYFIFPYGLDLAPSLFCLGAILIAAQVCKGLLAVHRASSLPALLITYFVWNNYIVATDGMQEIFFV